MGHFGDYQNEIYGAGLRGVLPRLPVDYATLVERAAAAIAVACCQFNGATMASA